MLKKRDVGEVGQGLFCEALGGGGHRCAARLPRLEGEMPCGSQAALEASAAWELWSCSDAEHPKARPWRHAGSF